MAPQRPPASPKVLFDLIDSAGYGYTRVWQERAYLLRLAVVPFLIKFILLAAVYGFGYQDEILRRGLIMLPGALVEGWVLAQFLRTLTMEERWPMPLPKSGDELAIGKLILRARGIISATLVYTLISLITNVMGWGANLIDESARQLAEQTAATEEASGGNPLLFVPALALMVGMIMAFPLLWAYIPYSVLMPLRDFMPKVFGFVTSVRMFGLFLICVVPLNVFASMGIHTLISPFGDSLADAPALIRFVLLLINVAADMISSLIVTTGMVYALRDVVPRHPAALADVKS